MRLSYPLLSLFILLVGAGLSVFHWAATVYAFYWKYVWLDTLAHFSGGVLIGALALFLSRRLRSTLPELFLVLASIAVIGIGWEVFEFFIDSPREANYAFDTSLDILMDVLGACLSWVLFEKRSRI